MGGEASVWRWLVGEPRELRRLLLRVVTIAIVVAAASASYSVLHGQLRPEDWRIAATSLGFAILSSTTAVGAALMRDRGGAAAFVLGIVTMGLSGVAFVLLLVTVWTDTDGWRGLGAMGLLALGASHASAVMRNGRAADGALVRALMAASIALVTLDSAAGALAFAGTIHLDDLVHVDRIAAVTLIALLATTALPPLLRRTASQPAPPALPASIPPPPPPPPAPRTASDRRATAAAVWCVVALGAYGFGTASARTEMRFVPLTRTPLVERSAVPTPVAASPPAPEADDPDSLPPALPKPLSARTPSGPAFSCGGPETERLERGKRSDFDLAYLLRGPEGLCVVVASPIIRLAHARAHPERLITVELPSAGQAPYRATLVAVRGGRYRIELDDGQGKMRVARFGNIGVERGVASFAAYRLRLPRPVADHHTPWEAHFR